MDILISIAAKIAECTAAPIGRLLGYLCFYNKNVDELKTQAQGLVDAAGRLQRQVDDAKRNGEEIEADVLNLLTNVHGSNDMNEKFKQIEEQANTKCCSGAFPIPNLVLRLRLSRRAKKMAQNLVSQIKDIDARGGKRISFRPSPTTSVQNKGYEEFETRQETLMKIMEAARDPNVGIIGVWGMGGVGKTMLAKEVARKAEDEEKLFSKVVFITVSQTPNIPKILEDIRKSLRMDMHEDIKERIQTRLRQENNILVIVDDVWKKFELEDVGISFGSDKKGCKILVTSRFRHVLNNDMDIDNIIEVQVLLEEEAKSLFHKIVGNQAGEPDFQPLATQIIEECGGLPIAITTVASALKKQNRLEIWNNALRELRKANPVNIRDMNQKVYNSIKLSYDFLQSGEAKKLLLLCSLFEEDAEIPVELLCSYGIGLKLFQGTNKLEEARDKTVALVKTLEDHSLLLLDSEEEFGDFVKLHDVIRDVVISIASKVAEPMFYVRDAAELEDKEKFKESFAISLYGIEAAVDHFLQGPKLKLLRLIGEYPRGEILIRDHFFEGLTKLLVLDLESLKPLILASSFCPLQNLQTLRLCDCILGDITWIGELHNLKILDLSWSSITELPKGIGKLHRLLSLDLQGCRNLEVIQPTVISSLTRLEQLNLERSFTDWEDGDHGRPNANLREVKDLPRLTDLSLTVLKEDILPQNMFSEKLDKFNIVVGCLEASFFGFHIKKHSPRMLTLQLRPNSRLDVHDFKVLLKRSHYLDLIGLKSTKSVAYELHNTGFPQLGRLRIKDSCEIRCIVGSNEINGAALFPSLESLYLEGLMNLENIIHGQKLITTQASSFGKLREIQVVKCCKLKSLFSLDNIFPYRLLERIIVWDCETMEEIFTHIEREGDPLKFIEFSELGHLKLDRLPNIGQLIKVSLSDGHSIDDDSVVPLFSGKVVFPKLKSLDLQSLNVGKIWKNGRFPSKSEHGFQSLTSLRVSTCDQLKGLIPSSVATSLVHLKNLHVSWCKAMVEVVMFTEESTQEAAKMSGNISIFHKLETLNLWDLPNLKRFCAWDRIEYWSSLLKLEIRGCPKLQEFIKTSSIPSIENGNIDEDLLDPMNMQLLFNHKIGFPKLESIDLHSLNVGKIWKNGRLPSKSEHGFQSLTSIRVLMCDQLKGLIPSSVATSLVHLKTLQVGWCKAMADIVMFTEESTQDAAKTSGNISIFPKLETLQLLRLSNLERFCTENDNIDENLLDPIDEQFLFNHKEDIITKRGQPMTSTESSSSEITRQAVEQRHHMVLLQLKRLRQAPSSVALQNMTNLVVESCSGSVRCLFYPSTVKCMPQLGKLGVRRCEGLRQVIANSDVDRDDGRADDIVFPQLRTLILDDLKVLEAFYWGDSTSVLKFPCLKNLIVDGCPGMKTFSHGNIECSLLDKILYPAFRCDPIDRILYEDDEREIDRVVSDHRQWQNWWKGDTNSSIQNLCNHKIDSSFIRPSSSSY